ncbi:MAG: 1-acyl-sn-glycerol-3-phosphate acyltransferase [Paracoccaceae bacterium]|jgi:glycerol-3-phosphate O-acyltransferase|nr:1-acyl-sn-glycerol-3-phosphate acyltransferase [Paracoccaceae bacterium]
MTQPVTLPLWALLLILAFAAVTFASHFLFPSVRWFFRRRAERAVAELNRRLHTPIQPFKLARRHDMVMRLSYDSEVMEAVQAEARRERIPENVAFERARRYAREIVPAFSAAAYFGFAIRVARWLSTSLYDVRLQVVDEEALKAIPTDATVVFVMNHRSNMDYVLVTYLVAERSALSYAVGEWARVWPLRALVRAMGAYFIRRRSRGQLYRRVLARYVQMAAEAGVTQALFPEGGLSLDGRLGSPKLGLLNYIREGAETGGRPAVFVPVALNYDRVLEDRVLLAASASGERRFRARIPTVLGFALKMLRLRLRGRFRRFGRAGVAMGRPLALADAPRRTEDLAAELMARIEEAMPRLPLPLVARALTEADGPLSRVALTARVGRWLAEAGADDPAEAVVAEGLAMARLRGLVREGPDGVVPEPDEAPLLRYYAAAVTPRRRASLPESPRPAIEAT